MLLNTYNFTDTQWGQLLPNKNLKNLALKCFVCGKFHNIDEHFQVMAELPQQPEDLIDDLVKMGLYDKQSLEVADLISQAELQKVLFLKKAGRGNAKRERLVNELIKQAGGLDEALAAAFGHQSEQFFNDAISNSRFTRRRFLRNVAIGAALVSLASCNNQQQIVKEDVDDLAALEKTDLKISFLPITCATPIIMSEPLGFYKRYGLNVELKKYISWAEVRDSAIAGELDACKIKSAADFKGFTIGVPYQYSNHNLILRYYLASGGLNPDTDVEIFISPPPVAIADMKAEKIDAFLMPDNFVQRVVYDDIGSIHILTKDIWSGHPCCAFAAGDDWIKQHPNTFRALNKAIIEAATYARNTNNRIEVARSISEEKYLNQPVDVLEAVMIGTFQDGLGNTKTVPDRIDFDRVRRKSASPRDADGMRSSSRDTGAGAHPVSDSKEGNA